MENNELIKYNVTKVDSEFLRMEFLITNFYKKLQYQNDRYEDILVSKNNLKEGECFLYVDNQVPNSRLNRLTKLLKDGYRK